MNKALEVLLNKKDTVGYDGMYVHELPGFLEANKDELRNSLLKGTYAPGIVQQYETVAKNGKRRIISCVSSVDKFISQCFCQILNEYVEDIFSRHSYAFQKGRSVLNAVQECREFIRNGNAYSIHIDFENFFDNIDHEILYQNLFHILNDRKAAETILKLVECDVILDHQIIAWRKGILTGSILSPVLSNIYLNAFDRHLESMDVPFVRYADDSYCFTPSMESGKLLLDHIREWCSTELKLKLNENKAAVLPVYHAKYFNYRFNKEKDGTVTIHKKSRKPYIFYREWAPSPLCISGGHFQILSDGILSRKDLTILFENEGTKQYLPVRMTDDINVYAHMVYSTSFFETADRFGFNVNMFNDKGIYIGTFVPDSSNHDSSILIRQVSAYLDENERLMFARCIQISALRNMNAVIAYYKRRRSCPQLKDAHNQIQTIIRKMRNDTAVDELMLDEAAAREIYYSCFKYILSNDEFTFTGRNRRPPRDAVNAMMSFGNTVLYNRLTSLIQRSRLDNRISFVHSSLRRKANLCLDLADIYKPILVDRTIFRIINRRMVDANKDFETADSGGVLMTKPACRIFIKELELTMSQKVTFNNGQYSYVSIIRKDIQNLSKALTGNPSMFHPYVMAK